MLFQKGYYSIVHFSLVKISICECKFCILNASKLLITMKKESARQFNLGFIWPLHAVSDYKKRWSEVSAGVS